MKRKDLRAVIPRPPRAPSPGGLTWPDFYPSGAPVPPDIKKKYAIELKRVRRRSR